MRAYHHTYHLPTLTTNCSNNYGPYHFPEKLIPLMILNAREGKHLPIYGKGGTCGTGFMWATMRTAHVWREKARVGVNYNIGGWNETTNIEVVHSICDLLDEMSLERSDLPPEKS